MTGDEIERAIEFLIESQARHDARMADIDQRLGQASEQTARTSGHLAQLDVVVSEYTGMQSELVRVVTRTFTAQAKINDEFRAEMRDGRDEFRAGLRETADAFRESLDRLAAVVERHVGDGHGGGA